MSMYYTQTTPLVFRRLVRKIEYPIRGNLFSREQNCNAMADSETPHTKTTAAAAAIYIITVSLDGRP